MKLITISKRSLIILYGVILITVAAPLRANAFDKDCFGQLAAEFAKEGKQGEHSSSFAPGKRDGLYNLAVELYNAGLLEEPTISGLGKFLYDTLLAEGEEIDISACEDGE